MPCNLRTFAFHFCEDWNAFFARMEIGKLPIDFQVLTFVIDYSYTTIFVAAERLR